MNLKENSNRRFFLQQSMAFFGHQRILAALTGLPLSYIVSPRQVLAEMQPETCLNDGKSKFLILDSNNACCPINANAPGTYEPTAGDIMHPLTAGMVPVETTIGNVTTRAAKPWADLPATLRSQLAVIHHGTSSNAHGDQRRILSMNYSLPRGESVAGLIAERTAKCLGTVSDKVVSITNQIHYQKGKPIASLSPLAIKATFVQIQDSLEQAAGLRNQALDAVYQVLRREGTAKQKAHLDAVALSQQEAVVLAERGGALIESIQDNGQVGKLTAALAIVSMGMAPVINIDLNYGGDNHADDRLNRETTQTINSLTDIGRFWDGLLVNQLQEKVVFAHLNTFGRTLRSKGGGPDSGNTGRDHWPEHNIAMFFGSSIQAGVYGSLVDFKATKIDPISGQGNGSIDSRFSYIALEKTLALACGVTPEAIDKEIGQYNIPTIQAVLKP